MKVLVVSSALVQEAPARRLISRLVEEGHEVHVTSPAELSLNEVTSHRYAGDVASLPGWAEHVDALIDELGFEYLFLFLDRSCLGGYVAALRHRMAYGILSSEALSDDVETQVARSVVVAGASELRTDGLASLEPGAELPSSPAHAKVLVALLDLLALKDDQVGRPMLSRARSERLQAELSELRERLAERESQLYLKSYELQVVQSGLAWLVMKRLKRLREALMPMHSRRDRLWIAGMKTLKLVGKEGPVAAGRRVVGKVRRVIHDCYTVPQQYKRDLKTILKAGDYKGIIVYPPTVDWGWMFQRPHHLMSQFAKQGYLSFYVSPMARTDKFDGFQKVSDNLYLVSDIRLLYDLKDIIYLISWTAQSHHIDQFQNPRVVYDYLDALEVSTGGEVSMEKIQAHDRLLHRAKVVVATARKLLNETRPTRPDVILVPNGVNPEDFRSEADSPVPEDLAAVWDGKRPIIGYYGAMASWFDYELLDFAAKQMPEADFVLLGPDYDGTISQLTDRANIHYLGLKQYHELKHYLSRFDVATIPFCINEITKATSPVKLFEYMAGGKPIVTSALNEAYYYKSVLVGETHEAFVEQLRVALRCGKDPDYQALLRKEMLENTWEMRVKAIIEALDGQRQAPEAQRVEVTP